MDETKPKPPHEIKLAMLTDVVAPKGRRYMGIRYCVNCKYASPALGLFYDIPERAKVFNRSQVKLTVDGLPKICEGRVQRPREEPNSGSEETAQAGGGKEKKDWPADWL